MSVPRTVYSHLVATKPDHGAPGSFILDDDVNMFVTVADEAAFAIPDALTIIMHVTLPDWTPPQSTLIRHGTLPSNFAWALIIDSDGSLIFNYSDDGTLSATLGTSDPVTPTIPGALWIAVTFEGDDGDGNRRYRFYTGADGWNWQLNREQLVEGTDSIFDSSGPIKIGGDVPSSQTQEFSHVELRDGAAELVGTRLIGGTPVLKWSGNSVLDASAPLVAYTGQTLTQNGSPTITEANLRGVPIGLGDWRMIVERMESAVEGGGTIAEIGVSVVGTVSDGGSGHKIGRLSFADFTDKVRGMQWVRGADEQRGRPRVGEVNVTVDTSDHENDPFTNYGQTRPGVIMRCGVVSDSDTRADGWLPQWTAVVDAWPTRYEPSKGHVADSYSDVTLTETTSSLARIDENALTGGPVGAGDKIIARVDRLLTAAMWKYGRTYAEDFDEGPVTLQSTDMTMNRVSELYLAADSTDRIVRSDTTGALLITSHNPTLDTRLGDFSTDSGDPLIILTPLATDLTGGTWTLGYDIRSLEIANDPEGIYNDHRFAREGGTQQVVEHTVSIGRFGRATKPRNDLICQTDPQALAVAQAANSREALSALRVENVTVVATGEGEVLLAVAAIDHNDNVRFIPPHDTDLWAKGRIRSIAHEVGAMDGNSVDWQASYAIDFDSSDIPGAVLDPAF